MVSMASLRLATFMALLPKPNQLLCGQTQGLTVLDGSQGKDMMTWCLQVQTHRKMLFLTKKNSKNCHFMGCVADL